MNDRKKLTSMIPQEAIDTALKVTKELASTGKNMASRKRAYNILKKWEKRTGQKVISDSLREMMERR